MNMSIQNTIGKILIQYVVVLMLFAGFVSVAKAGMNNMPEQQSIENISEQFTDKRIAGMIRSTIAFDRRLSQQQINIQVDNAKVTVSGQLDGARQQDILRNIIQQVLGQDAHIADQGLLVKKANTKT